MATLMRSRAGLAQMGGSRVSRKALVVRASLGEAGKLALVSVMSAGLVLAAPAQAAGVKFSNVSDSASVSSPVHLEFAVDGMTVAPASLGLQPNTGHFHVLVDMDAAPEGEVLPFDGTHLHYGKGQIAADVELTPGKHKLTLQFADATHASYGPVFASIVTVDVK